MNLSEKTHSFVSLAQLFPGAAFAADVRDNVRIVKDNLSQSLTAYVLDEIDQKPELFELRQRLDDLGKETSLIWCDREKLQKITHQFNATEEKTVNPSDVQALVISIIARAVELRSSDIHIRIQQSYTKVLYRIDGNLRAVQNESAVWGQRLVNTLYNSMCEERSITQLSYTEEGDARIREEFVMGFGLSTGRFASRPGGQGRLIAVIRLVNRRKESLRFEQLGLTPDEEITLKRVLSGSGGTFFSGPTGHGKSTVSQCSAEYLMADDDGVNLLTVEDPIESPINGAFQTPLSIKDRSDKALMSRAWAEAITNLMRLDPDRLYIGEVRDAGSANGAVEAIQTGSPVLTTIHTNSPADIPQRLKRFGVDEDLLFDPTIISGLVGVRLAPLLCRDCRLPYQQHRNSVPAVFRALIEEHTGVSNVYIRKPGGCDCCGGSGIRGRTGVFEVIETDNEFMRLYTDKGKIAAYLRWIEKGGVTLCENVRRLINDGAIDPVYAHKRICNLDRDSKLKAGTNL
ncbi:ATPase, T2SS/T4P/T4SS family [Erwinia rhapontici]|uniref:ATPase, T2SS/T4P/T4SS family n=1 Tax=Erwinia rhapontici TaxID=55212 RepID=UPI001331715F|nr:ATPase, T2SS/T4P/T4SS family [Erwinia rhapontici]